MDPYYGKWYEKHKDERNARRRERYKRNADYRQAAIQRAAKYRAEQEGEEFKEAITTPETRHYRNVDGHVVEVFKIGEVAKLLGKSPQTIRNWETRNLIPAPIFDEPQRLYTEHQISLLHKIRRAVGLGGAHRHLVVEVFSKWTQL